MSCNESQQELIEKLCAQLQSMTHTVRELISKLEYANNSIDKLKTLNQKTWQVFKDIIAEFWKFGCRWSTFNHFGMMK